MKHFTTIILYIILTLLCFFIIELKAETISFNQFRDIIVDIESNGRSHVVGDNGKSIGILQIQPIMLKDYNRIYKTNYEKKDLYNPEIAYDIFFGIMMYYGVQIEKNTNKQPNIKQLAFIWNGGGSSWKYATYNNYGCERKREKLNKYWEKVLTRL